MKLSLSNGIFSKLGLTENFEAVKALGFQNIEFNMKAIKKEHDTDVYREQKGTRCLRINLPNPSLRSPSRKRPYRSSPSRLLRKNLFGMRASTPRTIDDGALERFKKSCPQKSESNA